MPAFSYGHVERGLCMFWNADIHAEKDNLLKSVIPGGEQREQLSSDSQWRMMGI